jgi:hypothetical protein
MKAKVEFFEDEELKKPVLSTDDNRAKTLGIMPLCITTLSIMPLSISDIQHNTMPSC